MRKIQCQIRERCLPPRPVSLFFQTDSAPNRRAWAGVFLSVVPRVPCSFYTCRPLLVLSPPFPGFPTHLHISLFFFQGADTILCFPLAHLSRSEKIVGIPDLCSGGPDVCCGGCQRFAHGIVILFVLFLSAVVAFFSFSLLNFACSSCLQRLTVGPTQFFPLPLLYHHGSPFESRLPSLILGSSIRSLSFEFLF